MLLNSKKSSSGKNTWYLLPMLLCLLALLFWIGPAEAQGDVDDLRDEKESVEGDMEEEAAELEEYRSQEEELKDEIAELDAEIEETRDEIDRLHQEIEETEEEIEETEEELEEAEKELAKQEELLGKRLRAIHERGGSNYLEVLFSSTSFGEFLTRFNDLQIIVDNDVQLIKEVEEERDRIQLAKEELEDQRAELENMHQEALAKEEELESSLAAREEKAQVLEAKIEETQAAIQQMEEEAQQLEETIQQKIAEAEAAKRSGAGGSRGGSSGGESSGGSGQLLWPVEGVGVRQNITSGFGYRTHPISGGERWHGGIDIGTGGRQLPILAADSGTVSIATYSGGYGNYVMITHGGGLATLYAHLSQINVSPGQSVSRGQQIGRAGTTGASTGIHLHFEVHDTSRSPVRSGRPNDHRQNPLNYIGH